MLLEESRVAYCMMVGADAAPLICTNVAHAGRMRRPLQVYALHRRKDEQRFIRGDQPVVNCSDVVFLARIARRVNAINSHHLRLMLPA
jgi:hypothetical protein